ncbi:type II secretion system protein E [Staphylothermus marinus F1]|uniref:Type II secretion system protein E n=1 Tax=Staphylothermus marinus (strain ATCC 43588 / DSM 3639 / JCM 9404 / F1) TaxID=399550 RepID=A3DN72_STAMF|nr:type II/IV secretion system ATPase subunit [Staphylothermus marinus]ABN70082.1 type II secretion system protein E [Staphylothermus marinus F1]
MRINKFNSFFKFLKHQFTRKRSFEVKKLIIKEAFHEIIKEYIEKTVIIPVKPVNIVEEYVVGNVVRIYINRTGKSLLQYIVHEPSYDKDTIYAVSKLYIENPNCKNNICIQETLSNINDKKLHKIYSEQPIRVNYYYFKISSGYGSLYPLIIDPYIEEIAVNASDKIVSIINRKYSWYGWMNTNIYIDEKVIDRLVLSIARKMGKHLSIAQPLAEGLTNDGLRISLTYGREISRKGSSVVIRKKPSTPWTITRLIDMKMLSSLIAAYAWLVLELRGSILIVGGMSTGKTTLLQGLLTLIPPTRRVVTIEDTPEITGSTGLWDPLVERIVSIGESINVSMYDLLKFSLRRRADYIVVGEVRGREARLLLQASRLGHGVLATFHGEDAETVIERLISPPISIPKNMLSSIWSIIVLENINGVRRVRSVYEITKNIKPVKIVGLKNNGLYDPSDAKSLAEKSIRLQLLLDTDDLAYELASRASFLDKLVAKGIFALNTLGEELVNYYYRGIEEIAEHNK